MERLTSSASHSPKASAILYRRTSRGILRILAASCPQRILQFVVGDAMAPTCELSAAEYPIRRAMASHLKLRRRRRKVSTEHAFALDYWLLGL